VKPLAVDLCCGKGGWTIGLQAVGYRVLGVDLERFPEYPGDYFIQQDIRTLHGDQFTQAVLIVASPPCQEFTVRSLPWGSKLPPPLLGLDLFRACERIGREAGCPYVIENVRGARRWIRDQPVTHLGPFYLWGPGVPALFPPELRLVQKGFRHRSVRGHLRDMRGISRARRKEWSATCAMIPFELAATVGRTFLPRDSRIAGPGAALRSPGASCLSPGTKCNRLSFQGEP